MKKVFGLNRPDSEPELIVPDNDAAVVEEGTNTTQEDKSLFRGTVISEEMRKDKDVASLLTAVEQMVLSKQALLHNQQDLLKRNKHITEQYESLQRDTARLNTTLTERGQQIKKLELLVSEKDLFIDQLTDDYQQLQIKMNDQLRDLQNELVVYEGKYEKLQECLEKECSAHLSQKNKLEETIIALETEKENYRTAYENIRKENTYLMSLVKDFSNQMSTSFNSYLQEQDNVDEE